MPELIVSRDALWRLYTEALSTMDPDSAVLDVAGRTGHDAVTIEGVLASRESLHTAAMECGA